MYLAFKVVRTMSGISQLKLSVSVDTRNQSVNSATPKNSPSVTRVIARAPLHAETCVRGIARIATGMQTLTNAVAFQFGSSFCTFQQIACFTKPTARPIEFGCQYRQAQRDHNERRPG